MVWIYQRCEHAEDVRLSQEIEFTHVRLYAVEDEPVRT